MFEYVQEREMGSRLEPRTLIYVIITGEIMREDPEKLSERGKNQILELSYSRLVSGIRKIYSPTKNSGIETSKILAKEFGTRIDKKSDLDAFNYGFSLTDGEEIRETLLSIWNDENFATPDGESLSNARERFGTCMNDIGSKHPGDSVAVVCDTVMSCLFYSLVTAAPLDFDDWLSTGFASCASYEYGKTGWTLVMPPDNSFLTDPSCVKDLLPEIV